MVLQAIPKEDFCKYARFGITDSINKATTVKHQQKSNVQYRPGGNSSVSEQYIYTFILRIISFQQFD